MTVSSLLKKMAVTPAPTSEQIERIEKTLADRSSKRDQVKLELAKLRAADAPDPLSTWRVRVLSNELRAIDAGIEEANQELAALKYEQNQAALPEARNAEEAAIRRARAATTELTKALAGVFGTIAKQAAAAVELNEEANAAHRRAETLTGETAIFSVCSLDFATSHTLRALWAIGAEDGPEWERRMHPYRSIPLGDWQVPG